MTGRQIKLTPNLQLLAVFIAYRSHRSHRISLIYWRFPWLIYNRTTQTSSDDSIAHHPWSHIFATSVAGISVTPSKSPCTFEYYLCKSVQCYQWSLTPHLSPLPLINPLQRYEKYWKYTSKRRIKISPKSLTYLPKNTPLQNTLPVPAFPAKS